MAGRVFCWKKRSDAGSFLSKQERSRISEGKKEKEKETWRLREGQALIQGFKHMNELRLERAMWTFWLSDRSKIPTEAQINHHLERSN